MDVAVFEFVNCLMEAANRYRWAIAHGSPAELTVLAKQKAVECGADRSDDGQNAITAAVIWYGTHVGGREVGSGIPVFEKAWNLHLQQTSALHEV